MRFLYVGALLLVVTMNSAFAAGDAKAVHYVAVTQAEAVNETLTLNLSAFVEHRTSAASSVATGGRYVVSVSLPEGVVPNFTVGSSVKVVLSTIHHNVTSATVKALSKSRADLELTNQTQLLDGQRIRVHIPIKPVHLYRLPFQSIYSPRGLSTQVFVLGSDMKVQAVRVAPLKLLPNGQMIISAADLKGKKVVVHGTDNLIAGDSVQIVNEKGE